MATGFLTDTTVCIGCKACEVACKQWNQLPADGYELTGDSYDNTKQLSGTTWRHVAFVENPKKRRLTGDVDLVALAEDVTEPLPGGAELDALGRLVFAARRVGGDAVEVFDFRGALPETGASTVVRLGDRPLAALDRLLAPVVGGGPAPVTREAAARLRAVAG